MRFKKLIGFLIASLVMCETFAFAYQQSGTPPAVSNRSKSKKGVPGPVDFITPEELKAKLAKNEPLSIVDLRAQDAFEKSDQKIKGALFSRVRKIAHRLRELPRDTEIITYCACPADESAILGAQALLANGFKRVRVLKGGWNAWLSANGQVQPKPKSS